MEATKAEVDHTADAVQRQLAELQAKLDQQSQQVSDQVAGLDSRTGAVEQMARESATAVRQHVSGRGGGGGGGLGLLGLG